MVASCVHSYSSFKNRVRIAYNLLILVVSTLEGGAYFPGIRLDKAHVLRVLEKKNGEDLI